ncbi:MAG: apolipoprotein N-acyltransferase [Planctomycetes bacterium]|nr:apolipoprotein N-acyltransferase [Planctomycetota bacterium]
MTPAAESETRTTWSGRTAAVAAAVVTAIGVLVAAPWLDERCVPMGWLGVAAGLALACGRRGWRNEVAILAAAVIAITLAFHWTPQVLAEAMRASDLVGFCFAIPIVLWDACRLALPFWVVGRLARDPQAAWLPAAATAVVAEATIPGVFPWKLGYSQLAWPIVVQSPSLLGPEAGTFTLFATAGALVAMGQVVRQGWSRPTRLGTTAIVVALANFAWGGFAIGRIDSRMAAATTVRLALVQTDPDDVAGVERMRRLTREACAVAPPPEIVCWPECSGGSYEEGLDSFADEQAIFKRSRKPQRGLRPLPDPPCPLLLGGRIYRGFRERPSEIFQAALLLDTGERLVGCYHKRHLMPFGEYVPFADVIPELRLSFPMETDYDVGGKADPLVCGPARIGALLCYEDMVPAAAASLVSDSANVLVSLIHGAAFKNPLTLRQHRLLAQQRAIECRRCLVRCSSTGETCVIDATGRIVTRLPVGAEGMMRADVPLLEDTPPAVRFRWAFPTACGLGLTGLVVADRLGRLGRLLG